MTQDIDLTRVRQDAEKIARIVHPINWIARRSLTNVLTTFAELHYFAGRSGGIEAVRDAYRAAQVTHP